MIRTRVGYSGGTSKNTAYCNLWDHSDSLPVDYDPGGISYKEPVADYWDDHGPTRGPKSTQYKAAIFYHNEDPKRVAMENRHYLAATQHCTITTEILPVTEFLLVARYHQMYPLQQDRTLTSEFASMFSTEDFFDSTAAPRINGYLGRYRIEESLEHQSDGLGLSIEAGRDFLSRLENRKRRFRSI